MISTTEDEILTIVQAIQVPVIALLVLFSLRANQLARLLRLKFEPSDEFSHRVTQLSSCFILLGFTSNLVTIINNVIKNVKTSQIEILNSIEWLSSGLTSAFFLLGSLSYFYANNKQISKPIKLGIACTLLILFSFLYFLSEHKFVTHIIDFLIFAFTAYFINKETQGLKTIGSHSAKYIAYGFMLWAALQMWRPIGEFMLKDNSVSLIGYSFSTIAKGMILFGLYDFSFKRLEYTTERIIKQNEILTLGSMKFTALNKLINEIAVCNENEKVLSTMIGHLINSELFDFDYAIFSKVDYIKSKITTSKSHAQSRPLSGLGIVSDWVKNEGVPFDHWDVLAQTSFKETPIRVVKDIVNGRKIDLNDPKSIINKLIYERFEHSKLDRLFIPVSNMDVFPNRANSHTGVNEEVIGVLEIGYNTQSEYYYNEKWSDGNDQILSLYLNNIAQTYVGNQINEEINDIDASIEEFEKSDSHIRFIEHVLKKCVNQFEVEKGDISFLSLDNNQMLKNAVVCGDLEISELENVRSNNFSLNKIDQKKGIFNHVAESGTAYFSNNVDEDEYYIPGLKNVKSQLSTPLQYNETILGVMSLYSSNRDFFNNKKKDYSQRLLNSAASTFLRLKLTSSIGHLVIPYSLYDKQSLFKGTSDRLSKYFACPFITIWESTIGKMNSYSNIYSSYEHSSAYFQNLKDFPEQIEDMNDPIPILLERESRLNTFEKYALESGFNALLYIPVGKHKGKGYFITLLAKRYIENIFPEDRTFISYITNKFLLSMTFFHVFNFFDELTKEKYKSHPDEILENFMPKIQEISGADLVLLFIYDDTQYSKKFIHSINPVGLFNDNRLLERLSSKEINESDFSYSIIKNGSIFIEDEQQYITYRSQHSKWEGWDVFQKDFWYREEIRSLAALKIEFDNEVLGVLFLNFRQEQQFNYDTNNPVKQMNAIESQKLISLISNLIGRVIKISRTLDDERNYIIRKFKASELIAKSEVAVGMIHNIMNIGSNLALRYGLLEASIKKLGLNHEGLTTNLNKFAESITLLQNDYLIYREYFANASFNITKVDLRPFIESLKRLLGHLISTFTNVNMTIRLDNIKENQVIYCDKIQLSHVIMNLVKNAAEASASQIGIQFSEMDSTGQYSVIEIQDNGNGISDANRTEIFKYSFTTKKSGTGMGLPVSQDVMKSHGGRIDFRQLYQKNKTSGTIFSIYLPKQLKNV